MLRRNGRVLAIAGFAVLLAGSLIVWAAPVTRVEPAKLADPVRSLAGLKQLRLQFRLPPEDVGMELDAETVATEWRQKLIDAGFDLAAEGPGVPLLEVTITSVLDPNVPDAQGIGVTLLLYQPVHVQRLDAELMVPTYVHTPSGVAPKGLLKEHAREAINFAMSVFLQNCHRADAERP